MAATAKHRPQIRRGEDLPTRRGGALYEVPNRTEVNPTKLWSFAILAAVVAWATRLVSMDALRYVLRF